MEVSTASNPNAFDAFTTNGAQNLIVPFQQESGEGIICVPVNVSALGLDGVKDGANVTIEIVFSGGDGQLYQVWRIHSTPHRSEVNPILPVSVPI